MNFSLPATWTVALVIMLRKVLEEMGIEVDVKKLCERLGVGRTTAYMARKEVEKRLNAIPQTNERLKDLEKDLRESKIKHKEQEFLAKVYKYRLDNPNSQYEVERQHYSNDFKLFILDLKKEYSFASKVG